MNILHITNSLKIGGAERLLSDLIPYLNRRHHVEMLVLQKLSTEFEEKIEKSGVRIHYLNVKSLYSLQTVFKIRRFIQNNPQFEILHVHLFPSLYWVAMATFGMKRRLLWTEHSTSNKRRTKWYLRPIEKFIYSQYDRVVCISSATLDALSKWIGVGVDDPRFSVVENGVDTERFKHVNVKRQYKYVLIQVSRFEASKDQDTVIRAMQYIPIDVHLMLVGDGSRKIACEQLAKELEVSDRVHFLGTRSDIPLLLSSADVAIQSSHWEGFGLAAIEAMASGLPVVASDVSGLKQVVEDSGIIFPMGDYKALADSVNKLLTDKRFYNSVAEKCTKRADLYDIKTTVGKYVEIYEELDSNC